MKKHLTLVLLVIAVMAFGPVLTAFAQGGDDPACGGLGVDDCQMVKDAAAMMDGVTAFTAPYYSIDLDLQIDDETVTFYAEGSLVLVETDGDTPNMHLVVDSASISTPDGGSSGVIEIIMLDGMVYIKTNDQWYGGEADVEAGMDNLDELGPLGALGGMGDMSALDDMGGLLDGIAEITRSDDEDMNGQSMAVFTNRINIGQLIVALLTSPAFQDILGSAMGSALGGDAADADAPGLFDQLRPEDLQLFAPMIQMFLGDTSLSTAQWIGLDDGYIHKVTVDLVVDLDLGSIPIPLDVEVQVIYVTVNFMSEIADFNAAPDIAPPADYKPLDDLDNADMMQGV